jgi:hypothetical protein
MLQTVHQNQGAPWASSIYCRWIRENRKEGTRLVALWIDSNMHCFEREFPSHCDEKVLLQDALEEPGGVVKLQTVFEIPEYRS